jgi:hypothetical protein
MRIVVLILSLLGLAERAQAAWIELHHLTYPLPYCLFISPDEPTMFSVVLHPDEATNIIGARLRISGLPTGCSVTATPSAAALSSTGDIFSTAGAEILFSSPQTNTNVTLFEVTLSCPVSSLEQDVTLQPDAPLPVVPGFECPLVIITGVPAPAYACATYTTISTHPAWCEIGVEPTTWSATKSLFR